MPLNASRALIVLLWLGGVASARAEDGFHLEVAGQTAFPVQAGLGLGLETPGRFLISASAGVMPRPYLSALTWTMDKVDVLSGSERNLVEVTFRNALTLQLQLGWSPWAHRGFYLRAGYGLVLVRGGLTTLELISVLVGRDPPRVDGPDPLEIRLNTTAHVLAGEVGWRWSFTDNWHLQAGVGLLGGVAGSAKLEARAGPLLVERPSVREVLDDAEERIVELASSSVAPIVGLQVGYRFF